MRQRIDQWAEVHATTFDRAHRWPAATAAAAALRRQPLSVWYASDLARAVGASRSTLERGFKAIYGTTTGHYHTLLRLRHTVEAVRADSGSLEGIVVEAGWTSVTAFARVFRTITGMKPSIVRRLPDDDFTALVNGQLALPLPSQRK
jgi:transcriptional regulator GlxA family with amidase domain